MSSSWIGREATRRMRRLVIDTIRSLFRISFPWRQRFFLSARRIPTAKRWRRRRGTPQRGHDWHQRSYFQDPADSHRWDNHLLLALGVLFGCKAFLLFTTARSSGLTASARPMPKHARRFGVGFPFDRSHPFRRGNLPSARQRMLLALCRFRGANRSVWDEAALTLLAECSR